MKLQSRLLNLLATLLVAVTLSSCDSAEERAEQHYQNGLLYVASGEIDKALIEFRNVFKLDGEHLDARLEYARLLLERQDIDQSTGQYLRVLEQDIGNRVAHLAVGKAMLQFQDFEQASSHADYLLLVNPNDIEALEIRGTAYSRLGRSAEAVSIAMNLLRAEPANVPAMLILITEDFSYARFEKALVQADKSIDLAPTEIALYLAKLAVLEKLKKNDEIGETLALMATRFPENSEIVKTRIGWMIETGNGIEAERLLREVSAKDPDNFEAALDVVGLLEREYGLEAARAELEQLATKTGPNQNGFRRALATMTYRQGDTAAAIARVRSLLEAATDDIDRNESSVLLAFLYYETKEKDLALQLVDAVLKSDKSNAAALKMRGQIFIDHDQYDAAIAELRLAQDADPTDAAILVLQANAHKLNGSRDLALERMASAVSVSGAHPEIAISYAQMLTEDGRLNIAESVLLESAQRFPRHREILLELANSRLAQKDWTGAESVALQLRDLASDGQDSLADSISVAVLQGQNKIEQSIGMLQMMLGSGDSQQNETTMLNIVRTHLESGETAIAEKFLKDFLAGAPDDYSANLLLSGIQAVNGDFPAAEIIYAQVIKNHPDKAGGYVMLARLLQAQGRPEESNAVLDAGLANSEDTSRLQFMRATELEAAGDFEGAIEIYAKLYELTPGSDLLANNLASLLSEHRTDTASLEKAFAVSRRLRDSDFAPFQDTYGWVQYLRGDYEKALAVLAKAESSLGENPIFQYHLGMTHLRLNQPELARPLLMAAVAAAEAANLALPQIEAAKSELAKMN